MLRSLAVLIAAVTMAVAPCSLAAADPPNGDTEVVHAASVMLVPADLRPPIEAGHRHSFAADTAVVTTPDVCTARGRTFTLPDVLQSATSDVFGFRHRSLMQSVYDYGSVGTAGAAWNVLVHRLAKCGHRAGRVDTGRMSVSVAGQTGRWIATSTPGDVRTYATWVVVGTTVQSFEFDVRPRQRISPAQRRAVEALTSSLAMRWIEVDTPVIPTAG